MEAFVSWVSYAFAALATIPFLTFFIVYAVAVRLTDDRKRSVQWSIDITNVLLIVAVGALWQHVSGSFASWWMTLGLLLAFYLLLAMLQIWVRGKINWQRLGQGGWRIAFLLFSAMYVILFMIGIGQTFFLPAD